MSTVSHPARMILNERFRSQIELYKAEAAKNGARETAFELLLDNADISYITGPLIPVRWE